MAAFVLAQPHAFAEVSPAPGSWSYLKMEGEIALGANNYGLAERNLNQALKEAEKFGNDVRLATTLHLLGTLYSVRGNFPKAEPLLERELRVREKALGPEHPQVVANVGTMTQFYLNHGSPPKAERLANLLVGFAERKVKEQQVMNDNLRKLDGIYLKSKDYSEARTILHKLQDETQRTTANQDLELATTLDTIGTLYKERSRFDVAEKMYKHALSFRERTLAPNHLALAFSHENLGALYQAQAKNDLAQQSFRQALDITEKNLQPGRPEFFKRLDALAQAQIAMGRNSEAESLYRHGIELMQKTNNGGDIGRASLALGTLYLKTGKYNQAEPLLKVALKSAESANGPQHASLAPVLDSYADALDKLSRTGEAAKLRARSRSIKGPSIVQKVEADATSPH